MRAFATVLLLVGLATAGRAHFVFLYTEGNEARLVFGHKAEPDPSAPATRAEKTVLTARDAAGKETKLIVEKGDGNYYRAKLPAVKPVVIFGTNEAGVTQRGDNPPMLSWDYPKFIIGDPFAKTAEVGKAVALEVVPLKDGEKVRFRILAAGKPLADAEVTVGLPGATEDESPVVKTDKEGLTASYDKHGRYSVAARQLEDRSGEAGGKKYAKVRHTATVVFDFAPSK